MNSSSTMDRARAGRARRGAAALAQLAGAVVVAAAAAPALAQATNQPGESDLYRRSGEVGPAGRSTIRQTGAIYREREGAYDRDAWKRAWEEPDATRQQGATYQRATYRTTQAGMHPDDAAYMRGDRSLGWQGGTQQQPMMQPAGYDQYRYDQQYQMMNLPPASPEYVSEFNRRGDDVLLLRGEGTQRTEARTTTVSHRTDREKEQKRETGRVATVSDEGARRRGRGVSYGDVNYYSEIGYGEFTYYSDYQDAPTFPKPGESGAWRSESVASDRGARVTPAATRESSRTQTTETIYYTDDPNVERWLDEGPNR